MFELDTKIFRNENGVLKEIARLNQRFNTYQEALDKAKKLMSDGFILEDNNIIKAVNSGTKRDH